MVQLVECLLAKEKVVGSNPIARSKTPQLGSFSFRINLLLRSWVFLLEFPLRSFESQNSL